MITLQNKRFIWNLYKGTLVGYWQTANMRNWGPQPNNHLSELETDPSPEPSDETKTLWTC